MQGKKRARTKDAPPTLEPTIKHLLNPLQLSLALPRRDRDVVDLVAVEVGDTLHPRKSLQLFDRSNADDLQQVLTAERHNCRDSYTPLPGRRLPTEG